MVKGHASKSGEGLLRPPGPETAAPRTRKADRGPMGGSATVPIPGTTRPFRRDAVSAYVERRGGGAVRRTARHGDAFHVTFILNANFSRV